MDGTPSKRPIWSRLLLTSWEMSCRMRKLLHIPYIQDGFLPSCFFTSFLLRQCLCIFAARPHSIDAIYSTAHIIYHSIDSKTTFFFKPAAIILNCQDICYTLRNTLLLPGQGFWSQDLSLSSGCIGSYYLRTPFRYLPGWYWFWTPSSSPGFAGTSPVSQLLFSFTIFRTRFRLYSSIAVIWQYRCP